ncbi:MAG: hypothetical protein K8I29_12110 [Alphaproteobacteria bacterium]|uniref:Uncharacterized protein n=1 Tax=Candidatus Nitrobium versatile TaxID=2884831 RepID=A0A953J763_9BACT|nr:hypothetical protein [Candidatus Nitrobium versatile]
MKSISPDRLRKLPLYPAAALCAVFLLSSSLVLPQYQKTADAARKLAAEESERRRITEKLGDIRRLPVNPVTLDAKEDVALALKSLFDRKGYRINDVKEASDDIGKFITFEIDIHNYKSMADIIVFLSDLHETLPVAYTKYTMANRSIKVQTRCYYRS